MYKSVLNKVCSLLAIVFVFGFAFPACKPAQMAVDPELAQQTEAMPVKGKQGWRFNQQLTYGNYLAKDIKRGWTKSYNFPIFFYRTAGASQKFEFNLKDEQGLEWHVASIGKVKQKELDLTRNEIFKPTKYDEVFVSHITRIDSSEVWVLLMEEHAGFRSFRTTGGSIEGPQSIDVKAINKFDKGKIPSDNTIGYEFIWNGQVIGAVEILNNGRIWLRNDLPGNMKQVLSAASASLLLYDDLEPLVQEEVQH